MDETAVVRATAVLADRFRLDSRVGVRRVVVDLRAGVDILTLARECDGNLIRGGTAALEDGTRIEHRCLRSHAARDPFHAAPGFDDGTLGVEVVCVLRPVLYGRVLHVSVLIDEHFDATGMEIVATVLRSGTALNIVDFAALFRDDERVLELPHPLGVHAEVRLHRHLHCHALGDVNERPAGPDRTVKRRELVVARGHALCHEVLPDEVFVLLDCFVHVAEDDALLLPLLLHVLVDDLGLVLGTDAGERVAFGLWNTEFLKGVLNIVREVVPAVRPFTLVDVWANIGNNLFDIKFCEVWLTGPVRRQGHVLVVFQCAETPLEHPFGFVLVLADEADDFFSQPLAGCDCGLLFFLEPESLFCICVAQVILI